MQQEGKRIWVESLMTSEEWKANTKKFPTTSHIPEPVPFFECEFKWRWRMGDNLTAAEIKTINKNIDAILAKYRSQPHKD